MADRTIDFEIKVEGTGEATRNVSSFSDGIERFRSAASAAGAVVGTLAAGFTAAGAAAVAFGNELERQAGIFNRFSGSIAQVQQRTSGLVSDLDAMRVANDLAARGIQLTGRDLSNVMVAAIETASATGRDLTEVLNGMTEALGSGSAEGFQRFDVAVEASADKTETFERGLAAIEERWGGVTSSADTAGGAIQRFKAALENTETAFFETINDINALEQIFKTLQETVGETGTTWEEATSEMTRQARVFAVSSTIAIQNLIQSFGALGRMFQAIAEGDFSRAFDEMARAGQALVPNADQLRGAVEQVNRAEAAAAERRAGGAGGGPGRSTARFGRQQAAGGGADPFDELIGELSELRNFEREEAQIRAEIAQEEARTALDAWSEALDARMEREREATERLREEQEKRKQAIRQEQAAAREEFERVKSDSQAILQPALAGITDALSEVVAGTKTAGEAFQGLLSSFLEMIAQQAALEAAKEFAAAIGAFATYQYDRGALHLAAGAAWTGVAVAAGGAAIATAPTGDGVPASPQATSGSSGGGGNTYTYNVNGPVITAGSRANAGREISNLVDESSRRFGRS